MVEAGRSTLPRLTLPAIRVVLNTSDVEGIARGLNVDATTEVYLVLGDRYPDTPPDVLVDIDERYVGYPHVILGCQLCVYLDPKREWHPTFGMREAIARTWEWFDNAANDRFDPRASLFHAVGGENPQTTPSPTVVVRAAPPKEVPPVFQSALSVRTSHRVDLVGWRRAKRSRDEIPLPTFVVPRQQPLGLRDNVAAVALQVERAGGCSGRDFYSEVVRVAATTPIGTPLYLCLIVAHPTEPDLPALVVGRIQAQAVDRIREEDSSFSPKQTTIDWLPMSDERPDTTTRRDFSRPASAFQGSTVEMWGCGGLGSWIAELVTRASPKKVVLRDSGLVHRGHLVRQNYAENDVGRLKVEQLAERLRTVSDDAEIVVGSLSALEALESGELPNCDLIIDATIDEAVAYHLDRLAACRTRGPLLVQVATDIATASLGLVVVAPANLSGGPATVEERAADEVLGQGQLEPYHTFWHPASSTAELTPAPGCSVPTYHGAAADLAAIAGSMVSLIGAQLKSPVAGVHLFAAPHSGVRPPLVFRPVVVEDASEKP